MSQLDFLSKTGVFYSSAAVRQVREFERCVMKNRPLYLASEHAASDDWTKPTQAFTTSQSWAGTKSGGAPFVPYDYEADYADRMHYSLPILVHANNNTGNGTDDGGLETSLARGAYGATPSSDGGYVGPGAYNDYFTTMGQNLVDRGMGNAIIRLGWEFNLQTAPSPHPNWTINGTGANGVDNALNYAQYFRNIVDSMREVPGQAFTFDWNTVNGYNVSKNPETAYPGDDYVDYITQDVYDRNFDANYKSPNSRWLNILGQHRNSDGSAGAGQGRRWGLRWAQEFAVSRGKQFAIPEWGVWYDPAEPQAGGDNPDFIQYMYDWMSELPDGGPGSLAFHIYFNFGANKLNRGDLALENSLAKFQKLFGNPSWQKPRGRGRRGRR